MVAVPNNHHSHYQEPLYGPYYFSEGPVDNNLAALSGAALGFAGTMARSCLIASSDKSPRPDNSCRLHDWIKIVRGLAKEDVCEQKDKSCKGRMEWSNKSRKYRRRLSDWQVLCQSHHRRYDRHTHLNGIKNRFKKGMIPCNKKLQVTTASQGTKADVKPENHVEQ
jgi:hypothetical protein